MLLNNFNTQRIQLQDEKFVQCMTITDPFVRYFKHMLQFFSSPPFYTSQVQFPTQHTPTSPTITEDSCFQFFHDCIGAVDGTHICTCFHLSWWPSIHAQPKRVLVTKLFIYLWLQLSFHICSHQLGRFNCWCNIMEWCPHPRLANATGQVPPCQYWIWSIGCTSCTISGHSVPSERMATGQSKVYSNPLH